MGYPPFGRPYSGDPMLVSSPPPTKMFPFGGFPLGTPSSPRFPERHGLFARGRRSHSEIPGSTAACAYPGHIAACRVLPRRPSRAIHQAASACRAVNYTQYAASGDYARRSSEIKVNSLLALHLKACAFRLHPHISASSSPITTPRGRYKEVIRPQVPLRPPCYDFSPLAEPGFDSTLSGQASPGPDSGGATGGVCKEQGRIHRALMTRGY